MASPVPIRSVVSPEEGRYVDMRGITKNVMEFYGVKTVLDSNGNPSSQSYVYPSGGIKTRYWPKSFSTSGKMDELFGMNLWSSGASKKVTVVEGELDALSAYQMLYNPSYTNPVVSFPSGTPSKSLWEKCTPWLDGFDQIIVSVDGDETGDALAKKIHQIFPNKTYRLDHSKFKDANEFLQAGAKKEYQSAWWNAPKYTPDNVLNSSGQFLDLFRNSPVHQYIPTGIQALDDKIMGLMQGHFTVIKAPTGVGKSLAPGAPVIKADGSVVRADEVQVGDKLLGPDGSPRNVTDVNLQSGPMYRITPVKGDPFECNADHILSLKHTSTGEVCNVVLTEYLTWAKSKKCLWKLWRSEAIQSFDSPTDPSVKADSAYFLGVYLGDGRAAFPELSLGIKKEGVLQHLLDIGLEPLRRSFDRGCHIVGFSKKTNYGQLAMECVDGVRHIPDRFKLAPAPIRLSVLAGLLDTDGSVTSCSAGAEITQKSRRLSDDILFVARSLGLAAYQKEKVVNGESYWRVQISGDLTCIPCLRLKFNPRKQIKSVLKTGFSVDPIGDGTYRGIALDGDHLFLLGDFTVTHNTEVMRLLEYRLFQEKVPFASWHLEETKLRTLLGLVSYHLNQNVTRKDLIDELGVEDLVETAIGELTSDEKIYQFFLQDHQGADDLIDMIRFFASACDVRYVFFEPIQDVISGTEDSKEAALADLSVRLSKLAAELNVGIVTIAHTNDNGETKYCKMIGQRASVILDIHRDKDSDDPLERNTTYITVEKNRPCAEVGSGGKLRFNSDSFTLKEIM